MGKIIGIDLGTTNSCVAVLEGGEPVIIREYGQLTTPSVVGFAKDGERLVGQVAKRQAIANPDRTIISIKRDMGTSRKVNIDKKDYSPQEISAMILTKLKLDAEEYLKEPVTQAVIAVPSYFNDSQRQATKDAGRIAGLDVLRIINDTTATALEYGLIRKCDCYSTMLLVCDFGGGTFDVSILEIGDGIFEVKATAGDTHLGGDDFDQVIIDYLVQQFKNDQGIDLSKDRFFAMQRLKEAAEKAKIELSGTLKTTVSLPFITADATGPKHLEYEITRAKFEALSQKLIDRTIELIKKAMDDAFYSNSDIDKVILVGGSSRIPMFEDAVYKLIGKEPFRGINPDECVARGAAIQGGILEGEIKEVLILDVTPLSLGIETVGGASATFIPRNTTIPYKKSEVFSTDITLCIHQGADYDITKNEVIAKFKVNNLLMSYRGVTQMDFSVEFDANGIVHFWAKDKDTGKDLPLTCEGCCNLTESELLQAKRDLEEREISYKDDFYRIASY